MFLRTDKIKEKVGTLLVPFCKDCNSQEIETIQTCKKCGSHNITANWNDERSQKVEYKEKEVKIYKCDLCGSEFDGLKVDNYISYVNGDFESCNYHNFADCEYDNTDSYNNYQLQLDLCKDCKNKVRNYLDLKLINFTRNDNIQKLIKEYIDSKH